jgi:glucose-6-phosphate isomerase
MKNIDPTQTKSWQKLQGLFEELKDKKMQDLFSEDPNRANDFSIQWEDFYVDYSKNRIDARVKSALTELAEECGLHEAISAYYRGDAINKTENRPVLHTALRAKNSLMLL